MDVVDQSVELAPFEVRGGEGEEEGGQAQLLDQVDNLAATCELVLSGTPDVRTETHEFPEDLAVVVQKRLGDLFGRHVRDVVDLREHLPL